jgi:hypothetical protein
MCSEGKPERLIPGSVIIGTRGEIETSLPAAHTKNFRWRVGRDSVYYTFPAWGKVGKAEHADVVVPSATRNSVRRGVVTFSIGDVIPC